MNDKVVPFRVVEAAAETLEPVAGVVEILEEMLEEAKRGELIGVVAAMAYTEDRSATALAGWIHDHNLLGRLFILSMKVGVGILNDEDDD